MNQANPNTMTANGAALLPLILFLVLFLGTGTYLTMQGVEFAFYQLPAPIAVLPALILALILSKDSINQTVDQFIAGVGDSSVIAMCIIYLLAGDEELPTNAALIHSSIETRAIVSGGS